MRDERLRSLNFKELVDYGGQPKVKNKYDPPLPCTGFCISCEVCGLVVKNGGRLTLMSHGCDSSDFMTILGDLPNSENIPRINIPVMFLLEKPGRDWAKGEKIEFNGYRKKPPVSHYYWTPPQTNKWPTGMSDFDDNFYGPYFAYLMQKHQLSNVYITNIVKCKYEPNRTTPPEIVHNCTDKYLKRELEWFAPLITFCFGRAVGGMLAGACGRFGRKLDIVTLYHPSYIQNFSQTHERTPEYAIGENDRRMTAALQAYRHSRHQ